jgi:hypothetical protein
VAAARQADPAVVAVEKPQKWYRVKVHGVPIQELGLGLARQEIETGSETKLMRNPVWLRRPEAIPSSV